MDCRSASEVSSIGTASVVSSIAGVRRRVSRTCVAWLVRRANGRKKPACCCSMQRSKKARSAMRSAELAVLLSSSPSSTGKEARLRWKRRTDARRAKRRKVEHGKAKHSRPQQTTAQQSRASEAQDSTAEQYTPSIPSHPPIPPLPARSISSNLRPFHLHLYFHFTSLPLPLRTLRKLICNCK
jgi:hypothetical protein